MKFLFYILFFCFDISKTYSENDYHEELLSRNHHPVEKYSGSKTPYRFVSNTHASTFSFDGCTPSKIIGFIRHGTRTASKKVIRKMKHDLPLLKESIIQALSGHSQKGTLCKDDVEKLSAWKYNVENDKNEKVLTHEGEDEMIDLAERLLLLFPQLLSQEYSSSRYYFKYTANQRTMESARYFTIGLFGRYKSTSVQFPESLEKDPILRFYKLCDKWKKTIKDNPKAWIDHIDFILGPEVTKMCDNVSKRLGLNISLPYDDIHLMYDACRFETAWHKRSISPWCLVFSEEDLEILQYGSDLKLYWVDGYGYELNYKIACPAVKHVFSFLESDESRNASAVFYFTHSGTILKLLSHLGLYKDPYKLTSDLSYETRSSRNWTTSYIDAFGSNIVFVLFDCGGEKKVLTMHQERPVQIPGCPQDQLCPLSILLNSFDDAINNCNFDEMCSLAN